MDVKTIAFFTVLLGVLISWWIYKRYRVQNWAPLIDVTIPVMTVLFLTPWIMPDAAFRLMGFLAVLYPTVGIIVVYYLIKSIVMRFRRRH